MVWMETYMLYCSVRLGVVVITVLSFISLLIPSIIFFVKGLTILKDVLKMLNEDEHFKHQYMLKIISNHVQNDSSSLKVLVELYFFAHMTACVLALYGSLKLKKYFLVPVIVFECIRVILCLVFHIFIMTVAKSRVNLGIVITATLAGVFVILFLGYNAVTCMALYQIINLVNSERYKSLYGNDPFNPLIPKTVNPMATENVRILIPHIDERKHRDKRNRVRQPQANISILPVQYFGNNNYRNDLKWKQSRWPTTTVRTPPAFEKYPPSFEEINRFQQQQRKNHSEVNYYNWQWSELAPGVSIPNKNKLNFISKLK